MLYEMITITTIASLIFFGLTIYINTYCTHTSFEGFEFFTGLFLVISLVFLVYLLSHINSYEVCKAHAIAQNKQLNYRIQLNKTYASNCYLLY